MTLEEAYSLVCEEVDKGKVFDSVVNFSKFNGQTQFEDSNPRFLKKSHQPSNKLFIYYYVVKMNNFVFSLKGRNFKYNANIVLALYVKEDALQPFDLELENIDKIMAEEQEASGDGIIEFWDNNRIKSALVTPMEVTIAKEYIIHKAKEIFLSILKKYEINIKQ
jgi:hypothetical protein